MKSGNVAMLAALKVLGTGKVDYIETLGLRLDSGQTLRALSVTAEGFMLYGKTSAATDFMVSADELVAIEVNWVGSKPEGVTSILTALAHEKKAEM
jgi:hypothetical protein